MTASQILHKNELLQDKDVLYLFNYKYIIQSGTAASQQVLHTKQNKAQSNFSEEPPVFIIKLRFFPDNTAPPEFAFFRTS